MRMQNDVSEIRSPGGRCVLTAFPRAIIQILLCVIPHEAPGSACFTQHSQQIIIDQVPTFTAAARNVPCGFSPSEAGLSDEPGLHLPLHRGNQKKSTGIRQKKTAFNSGFDVNRPGGRPFCVRLRCQPSRGRAGCSCHQAGMDSAFWLRAQTRCSAIAAVKSFISAISALSASTMPSSC